MAGMNIEPEYQSRKMHFGIEDRYQSWATWHQDEDINRDQAEKLIANQQEKLDELLQVALFSHLGKVPSDKAIRKRMKVINVEPPESHQIDENGLKRPTISYVYWGATLIAAYTSPISKIRGYRYYLTWWFKSLT